MTVINIVYRGGGATVTFSDGSVGEAEYSVINGAHVVTGLTTEQRAALRTFYDDLVEDDLDPIIPPAPGAKRNVGYQWMVGNGTATTISNTTDYVKIAGATTTNPLVVGFTGTDNRLTYTGDTKAFFVTITASLSSGNNNVLKMGVAKNGSVIASSEVTSTTSANGKAELVATQLLVELTAGDYIEIMVKNTTSSTNITAVSLSTILLSS